jgi:putative ABC transport system permease protein
MLQIGAAVTLVVAAAVGLGPGVGVASDQAMPSLLTTGGPRAGISRSQRLRVRLLVVSQIDIAVVLLVAGGLLARSFEALRKADLGFEPRGLIAAGITLPDTDSDPARRAARLSRLTESIRSLPGVRSAGITTTIPLQHHSMDAVYTAEGRVPTDANDVPITAHRVVTPGYLQTLGVRVARGRLLSESDASPAPRVVVITSELARQAWPGQDPIGRRVRRGGPADTRPWLTVVGVVEDVKEDRFNFRIDRPAWYVPFAQEPGYGPLALVTRVEGEPADLAPAIRERVREVGPDIAVSDFHSMEAHVADLLITERFAALLLTTLALSGLVLATLGLYGAISHVVAARQSEIALRMAVGAPRAHVIGMVMREVATIAVAGVTIGLILAGSAREVLATVLYGVGSGDGATYAAVTCIIVLASAVAALAPTIRAIRVDPAGLLRS